MVPFDKPYVSRSLLDILDGNFDIQKPEDPSKNSTIVTYPLGVRKLDSKIDPVESVPTDTKIIGSFTQFGPSSLANPSSVPTGAEPTASDESDSNYDSDSDTEEDQEESSLNKITRIIQFVVLVILIWGIYMLYNAYKSRPSSIIKSGPSGRKKNVQWADQLRQLQEEDEESRGEGFLTKTFNKFKRAGNRGYMPANDEYLEDIEMGDNLQRQAEGVDDFIIDSDEEEPSQAQPPQDKSDQSKGPETKSDETRKGDTSEHEGTS